MKAFDPELRYCSCMDCGNDNDCSYLDIPCLDGACSYLVQGECSQRPKDDGTSCTDTNPASDTCCEAECIDTDTNVTNCGGCDRDCNDLDGYYCTNIAEVKEQRDYNSCSGRSCNYTKTSSEDCNTYDIPSSPGTAGKNYFCSGIEGSARCSYITAVTLTSFTVTTLQNETLIVWKTEMELDNAGFNIWRSEEVDGEYIKINDSLLQAEGSGYQYSFTDDAAVKGKTYYYQLEDIDLSGVATFHGLGSAKRSYKGLLPAIRFLLRD